MDDVDIASSLRFSFTKGDAKIPSAQWRGGFRL
jgi:hypothetical protein